jgi:hypothetical protein
MHSNQISQLLARQTPGATQLFHSVIDRIFFLSAHENRAYMLCRINTISLPIRGDDTTDARTFFPNELSSAA